MTAPSISIKDLLVAASVGVFNTSGDWPIQISQLPDSPDNCIGLFDSGGPAPNPKWLLERPDVSVIVRSNDYSTGYEKITAVKNALLGLPAQDLNGDRWVGIIQIGEIAFTSYDDAKRAQFTATFRAWVEPADTAGNNREPL